MNSLTSLLQLSSFGLQLTILATFYAALIACVVLVVNLLLRRWLTAAQMGLLWGLVLLRLLVPVAPPNLASLGSLFAPTLATADPAVLWQLNRVLLPVTTPPQPKDDEHAQMVGRLLAAVQVSTPPQPKDDEHTVSVARPSISFGLICAFLSLGWLSAGVAIIVWALTRNWLFARKVKRALICQDERLLGLWDACRQQVRVQRSIPLILCDTVGQPAVMGLFRTRLLLPTTMLELDDDQLRMIMLHELAHVRRHDIAINWLMLVIRAIHWWNPVYWFAASRFSSLREQACDAFVIRQRAGEPTRNYSELLLLLADRRMAGAAWQITLPASMLGFFSSFFRQRALRNRLHALRRAGLRLGRWQAAGVATLMVLIAATGLTNARTAAEPASLYPPDWLPPAALQAWDGGANDPRQLAAGPAVTRVYDVAVVLKHMVRDGKSEVQARRELELLLPVSNRFDLSRSEYEKTRYKLDGNQLTVSASLLCHEALAQTLRAWEQSGFGKITIESRFLNPDRDLATLAGVGWTYVEASIEAKADVLPSAEGSGRPSIKAAATVEEYLPVLFAVLDEGQAREIVKSIPAEHNLPAPRISFFNGQMAYLSDQSQRPFVVGMWNDSAGAQQPKIHVADEGYRVELRPVLSPDQKFIYLNGRIEISEISEVREVSFRSGADPIEIPRVKRFTIGVSSQVKNGQSLLIGCLPRFRRQQFFYALLTVRRCDP